MKGEREEEGAPLSCNKLLAGTELFDQSCSSDDGAFRSSGDGVFRLRFDGGVRSTSCVSYNRSPRDGIRFINTCARDRIFTFYTYILS